jgi:hypothetical protein
MRRAFASVLLFIAPLLAQSHLQSGGAPVGATGASVEASFGFAYLTMAMPSQRVGLTGINATGLVKFGSRWGAMVGSTYASTGNVLSTGHGGSLLSMMAGPVYYLKTLEKSEIFVHALAGASRVNGAVPVTGTQYLGGWVTRPSYAFGVGVERYLFGSFAVRAQADYQRTTFVNSSDTMQGQNNLLLTTSIAYRFGQTAK